MADAGPTGSLPAGPVMPRGLVVVLTVTGLLVTTLALQQYSSILGPVLLALVLVIGVHPLTGALHRRGVPLWLATAATVLTVLAVVVGLTLALALSVAQLGTLLPLYEDRFVSLLGGVRSGLASLGVGPPELQAALGQISFGQVAGLVTELLAGLVGTLSDLLFLIFVVLFMGIDAAQFSRRLDQVGGQRAATTTAVAGFVRGTRSYLLVSTVFGLIVAVVDVALLWAVGVPMALLWGLLAFVTNYIPNIGFVIGLAPPALLALLEGGPQLMLIVIVAYCVINFVIQSIIQPKFVGDAVNLSLTLTFLSLVFWSFVIGPLGAVLAIPLTLLTKALLLDVDPSTRWISGLLSGGRVPGDPAPAPVGAASADHPAPAEAGATGSGPGPAAPTTGTAPGTAPPSGATPDTAPPTGATPSPG